MPTEKRDPKSGAKLFIPTQTERAFKRKQEELNKGLREVEAMKIELQNMINSQKNNKDS